MADCKDCIHEKVCNTLSPKGLLPYQSNDYPAELFCLEFKNKADVQEVKHGYWKQNQYHKNIYNCSECGRHIEDGSDNPLEHFPYCHCGAKMDLKEPTYCEDKQNHLCHCEDCHEECKE